MDAMLFTKIATCSLRTVLVSEKFLTAQCATTTSTRRPGIMASNMLTSPVMFRPTISAPTSPKLSASKAPILMMAFSRITVSVGSGAFPAKGSPPFRIRVTRRPSHALHPLFSSPLEPASDVFSLIPLWRLLDRRYFLAAFISGSISSLRNLMASRGFMRIFSNFEIMRSIGVKTSLLASLEKAMAPKASKKHMNSVWQVFRMDSVRDPIVRSNTNIISTALHSSGFMLG
mmetsp:Transcript_87085/g.244266  ORF Transcript_87085/g.244266 Transcript_87085/m.244266 type:complete len:230 (-) Transcript_87085:1860-2549(-)